MLGSGGRIWSQIFFRAGKFRDPASARVAAKPRRASGRPNCRQAVLPSDLYSVADQTLPCDHEKSPSKLGPFSW